MILRKPFETRPAKLVARRSSPATYLAPLSEALLQLHRERTPSGRLEMSDSFTPYALPGKGSAFSVCLPEPPLTANCSVLVVEPDMTPRSDRERRLIGANYTVTIVREGREIVHLRFEEPLALAVVNDLLGLSALRAAAESIRQQWPLAKILVIGRAVPTLEDFLYDDAISTITMDQGSSGSSRC